MSPCLQIGLHGSNRAHDIETDIPPCCIKAAARIRDVEQVADGSAYVLTDRENGNVWCLTPAQ
ncbi:MAG TPA: hypothetical protein VFL97_02660 [Nitrococcus sp.]|nr:hypothetical protein [Nitrococcus sp.]